MIGKVNLESELNKFRDEQEEGDLVLQNFKNLFKADWEQDQRIMSTLASGGNPSVELSPDGLDESRIYGLKEIKKLCITYRLRFLPTKLFKNEVPLEAVNNVKAIERAKGEEIKSFMILAPSKMFKLEDVNKDPLLFAPLSDGRFYLIHQWGGDLSGMRKILAWPFKTLTNLLISIAVISLIAAALLPTTILSSNPNYFNFYRLAFFGWNLVFISSLVSYFWFALHQKFSVNAWNDRHFN
jgi:hypothetical protein